MEKKKMKINEIIVVEGKDDITALKKVIDDHIIRFMCDDIGVMQQGRMVEQGRAQAVLDDPQDPYTRQLLAAIPSLGV